MDIKVKVICPVLCAILATYLLSDVTAKSNYNLTKRSYFSNGNKYSSNSSSPVRGYGGTTQQKISPKHTYPLTNHLSGTGSKPAGFDSYPPFPGLSGVKHYPPGRSNYGTASKPGSVSYPASSGLFGNSHYPSGRSPYGTSGNSYPHNTNNYHSNTNRGRTPVYQQKTTHVYHHYYYDYRPPSVIYYHTSHGSVSYPVYTGTLPHYVYQYRSSENKYRYLLAGLALYNLANLPSDRRMREYHEHYAPQADERCTFGVRYSSGRYEEMAVDCRSITYFIYEMQSPPRIPQQQVSTNVVTKNVVTSVVQQNQTLLPNGTVIIVPAWPNVQQQGNGVVMPNNQQILSGTVVSNQQVNTVTTTTTKVMSFTDPKFSGSAVNLENSMQCYVTRCTTISKVNKPVSCDLLQTYAKQSLYRSSGKKINSSLTLLIITGAFVMYMIIN